MLAVKTVSNKATHCALFFFSYALAHYRRNSGVVTKTSTTFPVSRWWCPGGSEDNLIRYWNLLCELGIDRCLNIGIINCELWSRLDLGRLDIKKNKMQNDIWGQEVLVWALEILEFVCMNNNERIRKINVLSEKLACLDDPQCALGIVRHCIVAPKGSFSCIAKHPRVQLLTPQDI